MKILICNTYTAKKYKTNKNFCLRTYMHELNLDGFSVL